jgi:septum formation protein
MKVILGSNSSRRKEILSFFQLDFIQTSPKFDEEHEEFIDDKPDEYCVNIAEKKAQSLINDYPNDIILTADTIVYCKKNIYNKPKNEKEAFIILQELMGQWHSVYTGVCVMKNGKKISKAEETKVLFHSLTEKQIRTYHNHFYYLDKAAGYAIQGSGSIIVKCIEGCFYNIMGLPINTTKDLLYNIGINLWDHLSK